MFYYDKMKILFAVHTFSDISIFKLDIDMSPPVFYFISYIGCKNVLGDDHLWEAWKISNKSFMISTPADGMCQIRFCNKHNRNIIMPYRKKRISMTFEKFECPGTSISSSSKLDK